MEYNKLVRDKIPEIIKQNEQIPITHIAGDEEYFKKLKEKLTEEVNEFIANENSEELADIIEVIYAIVNNRNVTKEELEKIRKEKAEKRGGFTKKIILDRTE